VSSGVQTQTTLHLLTTGLRNLTWCVRQAGN